MFKRLVALFAVGMASASAAHAEDLSRLALTLGEMLGSEESCQISFDPNKVRASIRKKVPDSDISFMSTVNTAASVAPYDFKKMTASQQAALCEQMERLAKKFDLVKG